VVPPTAMAVYPNEAHAAASVDQIVLKPTFTGILIRFERRKSLKTDHTLMRDRISTMRDEVASELQHESDERVRIRVMRNADHPAYQQMLVDGLKGAARGSHLRLCSD
jgi:hypothetical protein